MYNHDFLPEHEHCERLAGSTEYFDQDTRRSDQSHSVFWTPKRSSFFLGGGFKYFPTCQVRVVRFYVSLPSFSSSFRRLLVLRLPSTSTAIRRDQCCVPDLNRDPVRSVLRAGPQPRSGEISVACRTSTPIR